MRGATYPSACLLLHNIFQSTLPREERLLIALLVNRCLHFNPRSHERSDNLRQVERLINVGFQSTLPRDERLDCLCKKIIVDIISIHAPTRGATNPDLPDNENSKVFQSTLPREERRLSDVQDALDETHFNPRSHERSDTHSLTFQYSLLNFNPRSHERSDGRPGRVRKAVRGFQSTLPREERLLSCQAYEPYNYFNPRSHERSDFGGIGWRSDINISIHAPTRGATYFHLLLLSPLSISIHAPTRGATPTESSTFALPSAISIHAPTRGATAILHKKFVYFYTIPTINI